jgi:site-specific DNA-methyltransferase (adenine-specific)
MTLYYADDTVTIHHGDCREILPALDVHPDLCVADPPYECTSLPWDRWPDGWPAAIATVTSSMWCFGSLRMFLDRRSEFSEWRLSQDVVWEKHNGSGFQSDRFRRVHEQVTHWYQGRWGDIHHEVPTTDDAVARSVRRRVRPAHTGDVGLGEYRSEDGGPRLVRSVITVPSTHGTALHPSEKPVGLLDLLIRYGCPEGGLVLDPFAGSGSTAMTARLSGRRTVLIEADEQYCEVIAERLSSDLLSLTPAVAS